MCKRFASNVVCQIVNTLNAFIQESIACEEISFERSEWATDFHGLRNMAYDKLYSKVDEKRDYVPQIPGKCIEIVAEHKVFRGCDPIAVVAQLTDREAKK